MTIANKKDPTFKILIIGDSGVGKSCIMARFTDGVFNPTFISTIGIDFKTKNIDFYGKLIKLQVWDTAGQERFHTITTLYYRGATGIFLMYDITDLKSFQNINRWAQQVDDFAKSNGMHFYETSAKDNINVETIFVSIAKLIHEK
ncbi:hypothetical protein A3Q56_07041, partial [Intoshia linei]